MAYDHFRLIGIHPVKLDRDIELIWLTVLNAHRQKLQQSSHRIKNIAFLIFAFLGDGK